MALSLALACGFVGVNLGMSFAGGSANGGIPMVSKAASTSATVFGLGGGAIGGGAAGAALSTLLIRQQ